MIIDGARSDDQLRGDLVIRRPAGREARDAGFLRREVDFIPATVEARVEAGFVILSGRPSDRDVQEAVSAAFGRNARLNGYELSVDSPYPVWWFFRGGQFLGRAR